MTCQPCEERRRKLQEAFTKQQYIEAARQMMIGAAEIVGVKEKGDKDGKA